jgi:myo-inositol-1(or 4)-monophosphatase
VATSEWEGLADLASTVAADAGQRALTLAEEARRFTATKSSPTDLVTAADTAAEALIVERLLAARPDDGIEGEEGARHVGTSGVVWHIDPIDGTTNFVYGLPAFAVSVAAAVDNEVVTGAVYDPSHHLLYRATKGEGSTCNGAPLRCSPTSDLATALVATGFGYRADRRRHQAEVLVEVLPQVRDIRRFGAAALDLCLVATGQVDAYFEQGLNQWDLAAGVLVATEAGARAGNLTGGRPDTSFVLVAAPGLFDHLERLLIEAGAASGP